MKSKNRELCNKIKNCTQCRLNNTRTHALCGEGNLDARLMLIAQAPGIGEDKKGRMFIGPSGKVLNNLLNLNNVRREELYMTNLVKCMLPDYRKPKQDEIGKCSNYLDSEIKVIDPTVLVPLGYYATKYIFKKYNLDISSSKKEFYKIYGKLFLSNSRRILPLQHPVAILYNPSIKGVIEKNFHKLYVLYKNCKWYQVCPMKRYCEGGILDKKWVELYCNGDWENCLRYHMEESGEPHPDWMLPDGTLDEKLANYENLR